VTGRAAVDSAAATHPKRETRRSGHSAPQPGQAALSPLAGRALAELGPLLRRSSLRRQAFARPQSACLRRNAGISISSMPLLASASTFAAAWPRALRHTLGVFSPV